MNPHKATALTVSTLLLVLASSIAAPAPVTAANTSGTNWPSPADLGLVCDGGRWTHIGSKLRHGPVRDVEDDIARQHWTCSAWTITMTVAHYTDEETARLGQQWARRNHIVAYNRGDNLCQISVMFNDMANLCAAIPTTDTGGQIHREGKRDGALETLVQVDGHPMWAGSIGAWERRGAYVASVDSWSGGWGGWGYFSADQLAAAAAALAANPPSDLPINTVDPWYVPTDGVDGPPSSSRKAQARAIAAAMRSWARASHRRYNTITPRVTSLIRFGAARSAVRGARFAGFKPSSATTVWIKLGGTCLRAKGKKSGTWKPATCPTGLRWRKAR